MVAFQGNITRVVSFMLARELSTRTYPQIGVPDGHHPVSHHQNDPLRMEMHAKINTFHMGLYADFLTKLKNTKEGNSNLLDQSMIVYGSGMSNSKRARPRRPAAGGLGWRGRHARRQPSY